jgi:hypothetical protein
MACAVSLDRRPHDPEGHLKALGYVSYRPSREFAQHCANHLSLTLCEGGDVHYTVKAESNSVQAVHVGKQQPAAQGGVHTGKSGETRIAPSRDKVMQE